MAGNKKPRKRQTVFRVMNPMQKSMRDEIALEFRLGVEAIILAPSQETASQIGSMLLTLATAINACGKMKGNVYVLDRADDDATAIRNALEAMHLVEQRFQRVGKYGVLPAEAEMLRRAAGGIDDALARIPFNVFQQSVAEVTRLNSLLVLKAAA